MPNLREIPVGFVVQQAKAQENALAAKPYRSLLAEWFRENHCEPEGYEALRTIDDHFVAGKADEKPLVLLDGCVVGRFRTNVTYANQLVLIIREIHILTLVILNRLKVPDGGSRIPARNDRQPLHLILSESDMLKQLFLHLLWRNLIVPPERIKFRCAIHGYFFRNFLPELP